MYVWDERNGDGEYWYKDHNTLLKKRAPKFVKGVLFDDEDLAY